MKINVQANHSKHPFNALEGSTSLRSGNQNGHVEKIIQSVEGGRLAEAEFFPDGTIRISATRLPSVSSNTTSSVALTAQDDSFTLSDDLTNRTKIAYENAKAKVGEVLGKIKEYEALPVKKLETSWKSGLLLGGIGTTIMLSALTLKLMLEDIKKDDPDTYNKLKNYQWPVLLAADVYGLLFFKKAYEAWHRPFLNPIEGRYGIQKSLAENGLVIPELITMLKQCELLIKETADPAKPFSPEVYELIKEKAVWAERFLTFLVEPQVHRQASVRLNLKSNNYALVILTKNKAIDKLNIKNFLPAEAKKSIPWHEQLISLFELPIDWTVGLLTGERLVTLAEVQKLYNQAWQQKLLTGKSEGADRYLSQVNAEIEGRATSDYSASFTPSEKQVSAMLAGNFPQKLLLKPTDSPVLTAQLNNATASFSAKTLDNPEADDAYTLTSRLNVITAIWGAACRALFFPKPKN